MSALDDAELDAEENETDQIWREIRKLNEKRLEKVRGKQ
jgi:hypothetical protein